MDTKKRFGLKKSQAIMLFIQMVLTIILLIASIYLLVFVDLKNLGGWMISSYVLITISVLAIIGYGIIGYKKSKLAYQLAIAPFLGAILVNILLPQRDFFQVAVLTILFALVFTYLFVLDNRKLSYIFVVSMVLVSLIFSIYSSITAKIDFLGEVSSNWPTYLAMYLSIFIPTIMSTTILITYNVRLTKHQIID